MLKPQLIFSWDALIGAITEFSLLFACIAFSLATNVTFARCSRTFGNGS